MGAPRWTAAEWREANALLLSRAAGLCEVCGVRLDTLDAPRTVRHHRQGRGLDSSGDRLSNLLLIHGTCHTNLHNHSEQARERGWMVSRVSLTTTPDSAPMLHAVHGWVLLDDLGTVHPVEAPDPLDAPK